jgi:uncharacterized protein
MLKRSINTIAVICLTLCFTAPSFAEGDPSMHEVYVAAQEGKFTEAQAMMDQVLKDHPNSAKAHFVEAELLAKQNKLGAAATELDIAEKLEPGLAFVKPETLQNLKKHLSQSVQTIEPPTGVGQNLPSVVKDWVPLLLIFLGLGLLVVIFGFFTRRNTGYNGNSGLPPQVNKYGNYGPNSNVPPSGSYGGQAIGQPSQGAGSGIIGSLATGAAMGAGVVAGEALMHRFIDGNDHHNTGNSPLSNDSSWDNDNNYVTKANYTPNIDNDDDLGGTDFGIADNSSWDDDSFSDDSNDDWT